MSDLSRLFKALSEEHRLRILALILRHGDLCVCEAEQFLGLTQSAASRHLRYLSSAGIVEGRREDQWVYYGLAEPESRADSRFHELLRAALAEVEIPDVAQDLESMRAERCACAAQPDSPEHRGVEVDA